MAREPIDVKAGFETEPEVLLTDTEKWVMLAFAVAAAVLLLAAGDYLFCLLMCGLALCVCGLLWFGGER
jgi:hypothetical protein